MQMWTTETNECQINIMRLFNISGDVCLMLSIKYMSDSGFRIMDTHYVMQQSSL